MHDHNLRNMVSYDFLIFQQLFLPEHCVRRVMRFGLNFGQTLSSDQLLLAAL